MALCSTSSIDLFVNINIPYSIFDVDNNKCEIHSRILQKMKMFLLLFTKNADYDIML
nr:MAG TPA: hypothetical protein [Caudoviricetes sp.]